MRSSFPASWATTQIESNPAATPSGPAPVLTVATTSPVAGVEPQQLLAVERRHPDRSVRRGGPQRHAWVRRRSGRARWHRPGSAATVSLCAPTTQTAPSSVVVRPTGPVGVSTYGASSTAVSDTDASDGSVADGSAAWGAGSESEQAVIAAGQRARCRHGAWPNGRAGVENISTPVSCKRERPARPGRAVRNPPRPGAGRRSPRRR